MQKTKGIFVVCILILSLSFMLIACGEKDASTTPSSPSGSEQSDDTPKPIAKTKVNKPNQDSTNFVYNGMNQEYYIEENEAYVVTGNIQRGAGRYDVTITLSDTSKYIWKDGSSRPIKYTFEIERANIAIKADNKTSVYGEPIENLTYTIESGRIINNDFTPSVACSVTSSSACGTYDIFISNVVNDNYNIQLTSGFYTITMATNEWITEFDVLENRAYDGLPLKLGENFSEATAKFGTAMYKFYNSEYQELTSAPRDIGTYYVEAVVLETQNFTYLTSGKKEIQIF